MTLDLKGTLTSFALSPADSKTATANGTGVDISSYIGQLMIILESEIGTTGDTLDVKIQDSPDNSAWTDVTGATFTQVTDAALAHESIRLETRGVAKWIRTVSTIAGASPVFVYAVIAVGQKQVV